MIKVSNKMLVIVALLVGLTLLPVVAFDTVFSRDSAEEKIHVKHDGHDENNAQKEHNKPDEHDIQQVKKNVVPPDRDPNRLWCNEHSTYEDECFICHPELASKTKGDSRSDLFCEEHSVPEQECGICHPELIDTLLPGQGLKIRLESPESAMKAGVVTSIPTTGSSLSGFTVLSRVSYDQNRLARITPLAAGVIQRVFADIGDVVSKGQVLVEITSPEIAKAKSDYLCALANEVLKELVFKREKGLVENMISSQREYEQAFAEYQMASNTANLTRQHLLNYGLTVEQIIEVAETSSSSSRLSIFAPFSGTLIERNAVVGEAVELGDMLFTLTDLSSMWLELSVPEDKLSQLQVGDPIEATFDALPGVSVQGRLNLFASSIDEQSRMIKTRAIIPKPCSMLKHGMFGQVRILPKQKPKGLHVAVDALHRFNGVPFVFVKLARDLYEIRMITLGGQDKESIEILEGILPQEEVVVTHSFTVKSEFLKSRLGAGCVDE